MSLWGELSPSTAGRGKKCGSADNNYKDDVVDVLHEHMETKDRIRSTENNVKGMRMVIIFGTQRSLNGINVRKFRSGFLCSKD